jgi:hypothetical protein
MRSWLVASIGLVLFMGSTAAASLIQPNTAVPSSQFDASAFGAVNTRNGSGLPAGFTPASAHAAYAQFNHWTTDGTAPTDEFITYGFTTPQALVAFYLWNHQSNGGIAANSGYDVTLFDLTFLAADGTTALHSINDLAAAPDTATGQTFSFPLVQDVSFVRFDIEATQSSTTFTGLAEVAFETPEPAAGVIAMGALLAMAGCRRRSTASGK